MKLMSKLTIFILVTLGCQQVAASQAAQETKAEASSQTESKRREDSAASAAASSSTTTTSQATASTSAETKEKDEAQKRHEKILDLIKRERAARLVPGDAQSASRLRYKLLAEGAFDSDFYFNLENGLSPKVLEALFSGERQHIDTQKFDAIAF